MTFRVLDLPDLRVDAIEGVSRYGAKRYETANKFWAGEPDADRPSGRVLAATALASLQAASLFYVTEDMLTLAHAAGRTLNAIDLHQHDLPADDGFIAFGAPLPFRAGDHSISVAAASWAQVPLPDQPGLLITWYVSGDEARAGSIGYSANNQIYRVNQFLHQVWWLGASQQLEYDGEERPISDTSEGLALATLFSVWHIMRQTLVTVSEARYDRVTVRRLAKRGEDPAPVRVIALRRRWAAGDETDPSGREYRHQWLVSGHWRQQWYPSVQMNRPVWIAPYIKGPDGAPMLGGDKVYALRR